jgi:hypothetical protein
MPIRFAPFRAAALASLALSLAFAACSDSDPVNPDPHANIQSVLVEVEGGGLVTFNRNHVVSGDLTIGNNAVVAVTFRDSEGNPDEVAGNPDRFELRVNYPGGNPAGLVFTPSPTNPFAGTFTRTSATATPMIVQFALYHLSDENPHEDGQWNVMVNVQ